MSSAIPSNTSLTPSPSPHSETSIPVNSPTLAKVSLGMGLSFAIISTFALLLRLFTCFKIAHLCTIAFVVVTATFGLGISVSNTSYNPSKEPFNAFLTTLAKKTLTVNLLAAPAVMIPKIAVFALYLRLFQSKKWLRWICWISISLLIMIACASSAVAAAACSPVHGVWKLRWECHTWLATAGNVGGALALAADVVLFCLPIPIIRQLNIESRKKVSLGIVFTVGILAVICSIVSITLRARVNEAHHRLLSQAVSQICIFAEGYMTIIVSCAPGIYSWWTNYFVKSKFYVGTRSVFTRSQKSRVSHTPPSGRSKQSKTSSSSKHAKSSDDFHHNLLPIGQSSTNGDIPLTEAPEHRLSIMKATTIHQWSTRK